MVTTSEHAAWAKFWTFVPVNLNVWVVKLASRWIETGCFFVFGTHSWFSRGAMHTGWKPCAWFGRVCRCPAGGTWLFLFAFEQKSLVEEVGFKGDGPRATPRPKSTTRVALDRRIHFFILSGISTLHVPYIGPESMWSLSGQSNLPCNLPSPRHFSWGDYFPIFALKCPRKCGIS